MRERSWEWNFHDQVLRIERQKKAMVGGECWRDAGVLEEGRARGEVECDMGVGGEEWDPGGQWSVGKLWERNSWVEEEALIRRTLPLTLGHNWCNSPRVN